MTAGVADSPSIVVDVEDPFGNIVTSDSSNVTLAVASGPGSLSGTVTVAASGGIATFSNVKFDTVGNYTLAASDGSLTSATSSSFMVSAAAASRVVYGQQPSNATAGVADSPSIVVDVEDQFGNVVASDSSNVTLTVASGPGSASGTLTVAADSGVATFSNVKFDTAGNCTLAASDGSLGGVTSNSFSITAAAAWQLAFLVAPANAIAGTALNPAVQVVVQDAFGNTVSSDGSMVTLTLTSGTFAGGSNTAMATAVGGVATFNSLVIDAAGSYTLAASDGGLAGVSSGSFTISPATAPRLASIQSPTAAAAGSAISPAGTVGIEDQYGNIVSSNSSTVTLTLAGAVFAGGSSTASAVAAGGVATFTNLVIDAAGSYTVAASDGTLPGATSNSFSISAAAASKVVYAVQPSNITAGVADSPLITIDVEDQFGNIVTTDSSIVTLAVASGPGSLTGTVTVAASGGIATFGNVKLDTAGSYTLTASDGSLTSATSSSFAVNSASASKVVYGVQPSNAMAGVADSPSITVDVEDQFGNIVASDSSSVTLAVASGPGSLSGTLTVAASSGIATFSNVKVDTAGNYILTASDGALSGATSSSLTVSAAAASKVVYAVSRAT